MIVEYHRAVQSELEEVRDYYNKRVPGLGYEFLDEFERQVLRLAAQPRRWMVVHHDIRRAIMSRFPYIIYFREVSPTQLRITVGRHQGRHPSYGRGRT